jgi:DNA-binding MarR family transcriptional regulator
VRLLQVTPAGAALVDALIPAMLKAQQRMLAPLPEAERARFLALLRIAVDGNNDLSRAPSEA